MRARNNHIVYALLGLLLFCPSIMAQRIEDADAYFLKIRDIAFQGEYQTARDSLNQLLQSYPGYTDASLLIAKTHSWEGNYDLARKGFNRISSKEKDQEAIWEASVRNELYAQNWNIALGLANKGLKHLPQSKSLQALRNKALQGISGQQQIAVRMKSDKKKEQQKNKVGLASWMELYDVVFEPMYYTTVEYHLKTTHTIIIPRINLSQRFGIQGAQYELDAYPTFSEKYHGYANYGYSNAPTYPRHRAAAEVFRELPNAFEASLGARYLQFEEDRVPIFTGSLGMYRGDYYVSARPYFAPRGKEVSVSGTILARKYLKTAENYFGLQFTYGFDSEFSQFVVGNQVLSETLVFLDAQNLRLEYQFTNRANDHVYNTFVGLTRQELAFNSGNFFFAATIGFQYQLKF
ncbi:YaiO family outer membrane beta-barrel protein [Croceitalea dokdonensis]|nr:YaiO family outer membrane beta-barrel protein [Croceitalea dokdonensis]